MKSFAYLISAIIVTTAGMSATARADDASPLQIESVATLDLLSVAQGGQYGGGWGMGNLDLTAAWNGGYGWEGFAYMVGNSHGGFSERYVGDAQVVSNIDAPSAIRLMEAWGRYTTANERFVTTAGIINLNGLFDTRPIGAVFLNSRRHRR